MNENERHAFERNLEAINENMKSILNGKNTMESIKSKFDSIRILVDYNEHLVSNAKMK